mmetsp:Transcript_7241/g.6356  ORF Transcript_7241/g.6356 Transcript_7241/m.6356 type:complete len:147 (-) Transcript_7241:1032-1472(-)
MVPQELHEFLLGNRHPLLVSIVKLGSSQPIVILFIEVFLLADLGEFLLVFLHHVHGLVAVFKGVALVLSLVPQHVQEDSNLFIRESPLSLIGRYDFENGLEKFFLFLEPLMLSVGIEVEHFYELFELIALSIDILQQLWTQIVFKI